MKNIEEIAPGLKDAGQPLEGVTTAGQPEKSIKENPHKPYLKRRELRARRALVSSSPPLLRSRGPRGSGSPRIGTRSPYAPNASRL